MPSPATNNRKIDNSSLWDGGIADYDKNAEVNEAAFLRSVDYRANPHELTVLPKSSKESGSVVLGLPKDGDRIGTDVYYYDDGGRIYKRTTAGSHSLLRSVANSHGNGMKYYAEDDFLYYTSDKVIGRYGQTSGTPTWVDDFLGSEGGIPLNTYALTLVAASSQYASRADTASLSITGNLTMEASINPTTLPAVGNSMVLFSKWDINANKRSYKFEIYAVSGYFGDGSDSSLTIAADTTDAPIDSACTGTIATSSLSATNASFAANQVILIHQTQGSGAGTQQRNKIVSYTAGTITLETALNATYITGAQVIVMKQYTSVTINSGKTWTAKAWNGTVGGIIAFLANGVVTSTGNISANSCGFRGASAVSNDVDGKTGEGDASSTYNAVQNTNNGSGGGGGQDGSLHPGGFPFGGSGGGGGGNGAAGTTASGAANAVGGQGGNATGTADLTTMTFGGGGGSGGTKYSPNTSGAGAIGGGIIFITAATLTITGGVSATGATGSNPTGGDSGGGGGGAGGSILFKVQTATLGTTLVTAAGGSGGSASGTGSTGGAGAVGRIHLDYYTSYTGTTNPTLNATQDNTLVTNTTYQLRLGLSNNGTAEEFLTKNCTVVAGSFFHVAVAWNATGHVAEFMQDGVSLGSSVGAMTAIFDSTSVAAIGADFNSTARNFYNGVIDEVRVWNVTRTTPQILANKGTQIAVNTTGLAAYYQLNNNSDDSTSNANNLTNAGSPTYTTAVPFASPTTRLDIDQQDVSTGQTYVPPVAISETAANRQTFVPNRDPQKSIGIAVASKGTGDWTITVHDPTNRVIATATVTNANLATGSFEFTFASVWRPVRGATYHFHITSTVADGSITTGTVNDMETAQFNSYYQFLVADTDYHPMEQMLNILAIGNDRYVATYAADAGYNPHRIVLPSGWRVRCFARWKGYLAIGCWKGTNMYDTDQGIIFLWDGTSPTYNDFIEVPEGGINAMLSSKDMLYVWAGYHGELVKYRGLYGDTAQVVKRVPKMTSGSYIETMPKAVSMWDSFVRWGVAGNSDNAAVERGVYTYGRKKASNPESLSYDFPISTGSRASTGVKIGFIYPIDRKLLIGWKDGTAYGMDVVDPSGNFFADATYEKDIKDYGGVYKNKKALVVRADFKPLLAGEQIRVKYKLNRAASWTVGDYVTSASDDPTMARLPIDLGNHKEAQIATDIITPGTSAPTILELGLEEDTMPSDTMY